MIRSTYRNVMLLLLLVCFGVAFWVFRMTQDKQLQISERQNEITRLYQEFDNAKSLNVALTELDNLTITEQTATQLDILRHLGLEQSNLDFQLESRDVMAVGSTSLYIHNVRINAHLPYKEALALCDRLQNTKKIVLDSIDVTAPQSTDSSDVGLLIAGKIYGLDKTQQVPQAQPETALTATETSSTEVIAAVSGTVLPVSPSLPVAVSGTIAASETLVSATLPQAVSATESTKQEGNL